MEKAEQTALDSGIWIPVDNERVDIKPNIRKTLTLIFSLILFSSRQNSQYRLEIQRPIEAQQLQDNNKFRVERRNQVTRTLI